MSWKTINEILGLASVDSEFCRKLLRNPLDTVQAKGFLLTEQEREVLSEISVNSLHEFSQEILEKLAPRGHV